MRKRESQELNFWPGAVDLFSSLFVSITMIFIMVLLAHSYTQYTVGKAEEDVEDIKKKLVKDSKVTVSNGKISISEEVLFDYDEYKLSPKANITLDDVGKKIGEFLLTDSSNKADNYLIIVEGHTDTKGDQAYNLELSLKRAAAVVNYWEFNNNLGMRTNKYVEIIPSGFGETRPKIKTEDNVAQSENRRIEIRIVPKFKELFRTIK